MDKFLLLFPRPISEMPTGLAYLNTILKDNGYEVKALVNTFKHYYTNDDLLEEIEEFDPSIIGINVGTLKLLETYSLIKELKSRRFIVIAGGPHATTCPEEVLNNGVDIVVRNEGEATLDELCKINFNINQLNKVLGISYKTEKEIIHNAKRPYLSFEELPKPNFDCFDYDKFTTSDGLLKGLHRIYCSRGCVGICSFCDSAIFGHNVRYRPIKEVINEIKERYDSCGIESFIIADDTFTFSKKYVKEFCEELLKLNLPIIWGCSTRASSLNEETLQLMKKAGCYLIGFGIESGDEESLKRAKKGITLKQAHEAIDMAAKYGFRIYVNLMTGFPWETEKSVENNISYISKHFNDVFIYQVSGSLVPYPGTGIYEEFKDSYDIKDWWLRPEYQDYGIQIHQNTKEPFKLSTYYQRKLYNDTYIWEESFFPYTKEYKEKVKEMAFLIGKRNLLSEEPSWIKRQVILFLSKISRYFYEVNPRLEKTIVSKIIDLLDIKNKIHDGMPLGAILKIRGIDV